MLYSVAIIKRPAGDAEPDALEEVVYGPVNLMASRHEDASMVANRLIAQAASEGKLPGGWTNRHYVAGVSYTHFT